MSLLAFDPDRLAWLAASMQRALDDLDAIRVDDPLAASERQRIRLARGAIADTWRPVVDRLLSCPALTSPTPALPDLTIGNLGVVAMAQRGWSTATDPLDATTPPIPTVAELQLLASLFASSEITDLLATSADIEALVSRLTTVLCTPGAAAILLAAPGWYTVTAIDTLADLRWWFARAAASDPSAHEAPETRARVDALDRAISALVTVASGRMAPAERSAWLTSMAEQLDPYAAALVVRGLAPTGDELGRLTAIILGRWVDGDPTSGEWVDRLEPVGGPPSGPTTGELLLPLVAADAEASRAYGRAAADQPRLLFDTIDDAEVVVSILSAATDPSTTSTRAAGDILRPILEWLQAKDPWRYGGMIGDFDARPVVASVVTPWLLQFHSFAAEWAWTTEEGDEMLAFLVDDAAALDTLLATTGRWLDLDSWVVVDAEGDVDVTHLDAVAATLNQLGRLAAMEAVDDARFAAWVTDHLVGLTVALAAKVAAAIPVVGDAAAAATPFAMGAFVDWLRAHDVLPPDEATAAADADAAYDDRVARTAVIAMSATVATMIASGALPPGALDDLGQALAVDSAEDGCAARDLHDRLLDFVDGLRGRCDPAARNALSTVAEAFLSGSTVNAVCD